MHSMQENNTANAQSTRYFLSSVPEKPKEIALNQDDMYDSETLILERRRKLISLLKETFGEEVCRIPEFIEFESSIKTEFMMRKRLRQKVLIDKFTQTSDPFVVLFPQTVCTTPSANMTEEQILLKEQYIRQQINKMISHHPQRIAKTQDVPRSTPTSGFVIEESASSDPDDSSPSTSSAVAEKAACVYKNIIINLDRDPRCDPPHSS